MNEIVKYHKDFENKLVLKNFTASELNFLMAICTKVRDKKEDEIVKVLQKGYMMKGKVIRPAMVIVCKNN